MKLLKEMVTLVKELDADGFSRNVSVALTRKLKGKKVNAFGPKGNGIWGTSDDVKTFKIDSVEVEFIDEDELAEYPKKKEVFASVNIELDNYHSKDNGLIYTDKVFLEEVKRLIKAAGLNIKVSYSEQGAQGKTYVNLDAKLKIADFI